MSLFKRLNKKLISIKTKLYWSISMHRFISRAAILSLFLTISSNVISNEIGRLHLGKFSQGDLNGWQAKEFDGNTLYKIVNDTNIDKQVLMANSNSNASGLFLERRIDLQKTPHINWSWKTDKLYENLNEKEKQGDDFVARIYIVIDGGFFFWKTRALNYVWSSSFKQNQSWPNPYTSNATMFAVESGEENLGEWRHYKRNVQDDLQAMLGKDVRYIDAIAVMTDSDNAGQQAITYYGDIYFTQ